VCCDVHFVSQRLSVLALSATRCPATGGPQELPELSDRLSDSVESICQTVWVGAGVPVAYQTV
jgi:hypothetical protein